MRDINISCQAHNINKYLGRCLLIAVIFLLLPVMAWGETWYVRVAGSDAADGKSWNNAFASIRHDSPVADSVSPGDTILFGAGTYYESFIDFPTGGTYSTRTVFACSSFGSVGDPDGSESWNIATLCGGALITGTWLPHDTSTAERWYLPVNGVFDNADGYQGFKVYCLTVNDTLYGECVNVADTYESPGGITDVNAPGKFYSDVNGDVGDDSNDTLYIWCYGGDNPNDKTIIASCNCVINHNSASMEHILFQGLTITHGSQAVIFNRSQGYGDSLFFVHCNMRHAGAQWGANGSILYSNLPDDNNYHPKYWRVQACSLASASDAGTGMVYGDTFAIHQGDGAVMYKMEYMTWDSCAFYQYRGEGAGHLNMAIYFKCDGAPWPNPYGAIGNNIKFCTADSMINNGFYYGNFAHECSTYGCWVSYSANHAFQAGWKDGTNQKNGNVYFLNNSAYYCNQQYHLNEETYDDTMHFKLYYNLGYDIEILNSSVDHTHGVVTNETDVAGDTDADSNFYVDPDDTFQGLVNYHGVTWSAYQDSGLDIHGDTLSNWNFTDPANGDFSIPDSVKDNIKWSTPITYGGRTWYGPGAIQTQWEDGEWSLSQSVTCIDTNDVNIRIRVDFTASNGAEVDSVKFYLSDDNFSTLLDSVRIETPSDPQDTAFSGLTQNTPYYVRTVAIDNDSGYADTSSIITRTTLYTPSHSVSSPSHDSTTIDVINNYTANSVDSIRLIYDDDGDFSSSDTVLESSGINDPDTLVAINCSYETLYYLKFAIYDQLGWNEANSIQVTTDTGPSEPPATVNRRMRGWK